MSHTKQLIKHVQAYCKGKTIFKNQILYVFDNIDQQNLKVIISNTCMFNVVVLDATTLDISMKLRSQVNKILYFKDCLYSN